MIIVVSVSKVLLFGSILVKSVSGLWPIPQSYTSGSGNVMVDLDRLTIINSGCASDILSRAITRYSCLIKKEKFSPPLDYNISAISPVATLSRLEITVNYDNTVLNLDTDESYSLVVNNDGSSCLEANSVYGAIRGLETFSQIIVDNYGKKIIKNTPISIQDAPTFKHRGILLDTSRNYYSLDSIKRTIDGMAYTKLNVLHWHIVDSQSWPVESKFLPDLYKKGAYSLDMVYMHTDVTNIIDYARDRGVRVIPEFDVPGHTYIVGKAKPEIMSCLDVQPRWDLNAAEPPSGQLNIAKQGALDFTGNVLDEYASLFTDNVFNVGGDEVNRNCWNEDPYFIQYLSENPTEDVESVLRSYYAFVYAKVAALNKTPMCWEETLMHTNFSLPTNTIVQAWIDEASVPEIVNRGYRVVASPYTSSYLDCGHGAWLSNWVNGNSWCDPFKSWMKVYSYNPLVNITTPAARSLVLGGEVALWAEQSDEIVVDKLLWPRAAAAGELYWSGPYVPNTTTKRDINDAAIRISEHRFRLLARGIQAEPTQPLWCIRNPGHCNLPETLL
ncbi:Beta-hexosaminidase 2 [Smittium mucronatum]|uniref:Beta-hexosaminidase n=1 Tax=Smittium mucronatum TaxID=133383 RepID=A0A1R0H1X0_9FUNG|nr:Beta-hexosaminidase 2 [Smittium mucronatum]